MAASVRLPLKQSTTPSIVDGSSIPTANGFGRPNYPSCRNSVIQIQILRLFVDCWFNFHVSAPEWFVFRSTHFRSCFMIQFGVLLLLRCCQYRLIGCWRFTVWYILMGVVCVSVISHFEADGLVLLWIAGLWWMWDETGSSKGSWLSMSFLWAGFSLDCFRFWLCPLSIVHYLRRRRFRLIQTFAFGFVLAAKSSYQYSTCQLESACIYHWGNLY